MKMESNTRYLICTVYDMLSLIDDFISGPFNRTELEGVEEEARKLLELIRDSINRTELKVTKDESHKLIELRAAVVQALIRIERL